jgi:hypothetical protein
MHVAQKCEAVLGQRLASKPRLEAGRMTLFKHDTL